MAKSKGKAARLEERRRKGPSKFEQLRGPNYGVWQNTFFNIRTNQKGIKAGIDNWWQQTRGDK